MVPKLEQKCTTAWTFVGAREGSRTAISTRTSGDLEPRLRKSMHAARCSVAAEGCILMALTAKWCPAKQRRHSAGFPVGKYSRCDELTQHRLNGTTAKK